MMNNKKWIVLIVMIISFTIVNAQTKFKNVADAVEALRVAMVDANVPMLTLLTDDSLTYGHSSGKIQNKSEFIQSLGSGESDFVSIDLTHQSIKMFGNIATVRHTFTAITNDNKKQGNVKIDILLVWKRSHHTWKLIARQAVKSPQ
ncbi:MAG: nuclear transport factor 2 family protein [Ferruginibacter sp.]